METAIEEAKAAGHEEGAKNKTVELARNLLDFLDNATIALKQDFPKKFNHYR